MASQLVYLIPLFLIGLGIVNLFPAVIKWRINRRNQFLGMKTKITDKTISFHQTLGVGVILIGLMAFFYFHWLLSL